DVNELNDVEERRAVVPQVWEIDIMITKHNDEIIQIEER
uniref:Very early lactation protein (Fragments) n=1 Tax=Trichosurus vulpecula TaxID=9337 RepID=VELAC_TRIVU|nr:RecName: Full=Very early lactation protein; Short=VELP [Trichosurus vulpecula]